MIPIKQLNLAAGEAVRTLAVDFDAINENPFLDFDYGYSYTEQRKMHADAYLDDKALNVADIEETVRHMVQSAFEGRQKL